MIICHSQIKTSKIYKKAEGIGNYFFSYSVSKLNTPDISTIFSGVSNVSENWSLWMKAKV